jgi:uncharacterized protein YjfI (DUF2170 family)
MKISDINIHIRKEENLLRFLSLNDFSVSECSENVIRVQRADELPVFLHTGENGIYFEVDLGNISQFADKDLYFKLLDLNTEILPVSFGINNTNQEDPKLVLVESRIYTDLNDDELLSVFDALELAVDKAEALLSQYL